MKESNPKKNTLQQDKDLFVHITEQNNENHTTQDLQVAFKSSIESVTSIFKNLSEVIEAQILDTPTRENASKLVEDLNTEVLDVISKFKQSAVDGFQRYQQFEEE